MKTETKNNSIINCKKCNVQEITGDSRYSMYLLSCKPGVESDGIPFVGAAEYKDDQLYISTISLEVPLILTAYCCFINAYSGTTILYYVGVFGC